MTRGDFALLPATVRRALPLIPAVGLLLLAGCSKGGPGSSASGAAFDSAPAEIKKTWNDANAAWKGHHYLDAATAFVSLQAKASTLSQPQADELAKAVDQFGQEAFVAANKGDAGATQAVQALRAAGRRSGTSP